MKTRFLDILFFIALVILAGMNVLNRLEINTIKQQQKIIIGSLITNLEATRTLADDYINRMAEGK